MKGETSMRYVQGHNREQETMFPSVMDDYIPEDNPVRFLDAYVDTLNLYELGFTHADPQAIGRKPYNPADILKLYIYGYLNRLRSSRMLEKETIKNLEVIWLLRGLRPDFKTIADFRKDNKDALKKVHREFIFYCRELNLFELELIAIDGSKFAAVNHTRKAYSKNKITKLIKEIDQSINEYFDKIEQNDRNENEISKSTTDEFKKKIKKLERQKDILQGYEDQLKETGETQIVLTDPDSRVMRTGHNGKDVCYNVQMAVDSKHKLIVDFDVTNEETDLHQLGHMTRQVKEIFQIENFKAVADLGYFEKYEIKNCHDNQVECYIPEGNKSQNNEKGLYTNKNFQYDADNDYYICPAKQQLKWTRIRNHAGKKEKVYWTAACRQCKQKSKCTTSKDLRHIYRWEHEDIIDAMRKRVKENPEIIAARREMVEHPFGTLKHSMGHHYFLCKGIEMVKTEMSLSVLAYNIKRVLNIMGVKQLISIIKMCKSKTRDLESCLLSYFSFSLIKIGKLAVR